MARILESGAKFVLSAPGKTWLPTGGHLGYRGAEKLFIRVRAELTRMPGIVHRFSQSELHGLVSSVGLAVVEQRPHPGGYGLLLKKQ